MPTVPHIVSVIDTSWVMWVLLGLFLLAVGVLRFRVADLAGQFKQLSSHADRSYMGVNSDPGSLVVRWLITMTVVAFAVGLLVLEPREWTFVAFARILLIAVIVLVVRNVLFYWVLFTAFERKKRELVQEQYTLLSQSCTCIMLPLLVVIMHLPSMAWVQGALVGCLVIWCLLLAFRFFQTFGWSPLTIGYMLLYIVCLQVIPLGSVWMLSAK